MFSYMTCRDEWQVFRSNVTSGFRCGETGAAGGMTPALVVGIAGSFANHERSPLTKQYNWLQIKRK
jgi:hypothetical protein